MTLFVDTSVWSLALRRDAPGDSPEVEGLREALEGGREIATTGLVLQELLQGFSGPGARKQIIESFSAFPLVAPEREDHIEAAELRNRCRRAGLQIGTIDAIIAWLCIRHGMTLLTTDHDFIGVAGQAPLRLWTAPRRR